MKQCFLPGVERLALKALGSLRTSFSALGATRSALDRQP
jgi:hypothetical protein